MSNRQQLTPDQRHWSYNVQTRKIPGWVEAFEYAHELGLQQNRDLVKDVIRALKEGNRRLKVREHGNEAYVQLCHAYQTWIDETIKVLESE